MGAGPRRFQVREDMWGSRKIAEGIPQGLKPLSLGGERRAKLEGLAYLEAVRALRECPLGR
jgi:hypothetical protein